MQQEELMSKVRLSVSVSDSHVKQLGKVAKAAAKAGMKVEQQLEGLGVFTGVIDPKKVDQLRKVDGISHVEQERAVGVAPPGSPVQ
jgi:hypothetical protein